MVSLIRGGISARAIWYTGRLSRVRTSVSFLSSGFVRSVVVRGYLLLTCRVTALSIVVVLVVLYCVVLGDLLAILYTSTPSTVTVYNSNFSVIFEYSSSGHLCCREMDK